MAETAEKPWRNRLKSSWTRLFFIFCQIFVGKKWRKAFFNIFSIRLIVDDFLKWSAPRALPNFVKSPNMHVKIWQKMKKSLVQLAFKPFLADSRYPKIGFRVPVPPLLSKRLKVQSQFWCNNLLHIETLKIMTSILTIKRAFVGNCLSFRKIYFSNISSTLINFLLILFSRSLL